LGSLGILGATIAVDLGPIATVSAGEALEALDYY
jgi:hypothetical protein